MTNPGATPDLPQAPDAERSLLGGLLIDPTMLATIAEQVSPRHFYAEKNRIIFGAMLELADKGGQCDPVSVIEHLRLAGKLERAGSVPYIMGLQDETTGAWLAEQHAGIVVDKARLRELITFSQYLHSRALSGDEAASVYADATLKMAELGFAEHRGNLHERYADEAESILGEELGGYLPTGYRALDRMIGGLKGFVVLAGRPSQGKSSLSRDILRNVAKRGKQVALFTPDQSGADIYRLEASLRAEVPLARIKAQEAQPHEVERWRKELGRVRRDMHERFAVDDRPLTLPAMVSRIRAAVQWGAELVAVDYMQLVDVPGLRADGEFHAVTAVSKALKRLARELSIPILVLAQLNRGVEQRRDPRPMLSDLRSSGQIEQDADAVLFVYRANPSSNPIEPIDVIVAKQKDGPIGALQLLLNKPLTTFMDI